MKKILLVCLFMVALATKAQDNTDFKSETVEFLKITGAGVAFENAIAQIGAGVSEENQDAYTQGSQRNISWIV